MRDTAALSRVLDRQQLLAVLVRIQNRGRNQHRDILTFAGFCADRDELADYVMGQFRHLTRVDQLDVFMFTHTLAREAAA